MGGYALGVQQAEQDRARQFARKDMLTDEQHAIKRDDLIKAKDSLTSQLANYKDANGNLIPEMKPQYDRTMAALSQNQYDFGQLYDPIKAPGRLQQDWHLLREKIHGIAKPKDNTPSSITTQAPAMTLNTPVAPLVTPELPAYQQVTPALPSQGGNKVTNVPGVAAETVPGMTTPAPAPLLVTQSFGNDPVPGMTAKGNADLSKRPNIDNGDGTHSSTFSMSFGTDKGEVLVPGVGDGKTYPVRQLRVLYTLPDGSQKWAVPGNQPHNWIAPERPTPQNNEALNQYQKTGKNFGTFEDDKAADAYGKALHEDQEKYGNSGSTAHPVSPSGNVTIPAGPPVTVTKTPAPTWGQAQVLKQKAAAMQKAQQEAGLLAAAAPLSPQQAAVSSANVANAGSLADIQGKIKNYKILNPNATEEDVSAYASTLLPGNNQVGNWERVDGTLDGQPYAISYDKRRGVYKSPDGTIASNMSENFKPSPKATGIAAEEIKEYQNDPDPNKGSITEWKAKKAATGRVAAPKPETLDNQYKAILVKEASGKPLTPDESAHKAAWQLYNQETKVDPGIARAAAFGAMRYIPVVDPSNTENVVMMRAGDAARSGVNTPASIGFKTDQAITRYMTSGAGGTNINYFNTATDHLRILAQAGEALNNGNMQLFNSLGNRFSAATGDPAPSNFETVKAAVAGELSKTFKGTGATDSEIADINQTINQAQSPQQISGAISYYTSLMGGKVHALQSQYEAAKQGKPNFPGATPSTSQGKGSRSLAAAMALPINKGKSAVEVQKHLESLGYTVTKP